MKNGLLIILMIPSYIALAQNLEKKTTQNSFNLKLGPSYIAGDGVKKLGNTIGLSIENKFSKHLSLGISLDGGNLKTKPYTGYSYSSKTAFVQFSSTLKYNIQKPESKFIIAPFAGVGYTIYNSKVLEANTIIRYANGTSTKTKSVGNLVFPIGIDLGMRVGKNTIGLEFCSNYIQSDRFDATIGQFSGSDGHIVKGKVTDLSKGQIGKTKNDVWVGVRLKLSVPIQWKQEKRKQTHHSN